MQVTTGAVPSDRPGTAGPRLPTEESPSLSAFSIYHEDWWLDAVTDGNWREAVVEDRGAIVGRMPYILERKAGVRISRLPSLVRTLGPVIAPAVAAETPSLGRRLDIADALIDQLPTLAWFEQLFDPRIDEGNAFARRGYAVGHAYTFVIPAGRTEDELWNDVTFKTRNHIRKAARALTVAPISDPEEFCRFYDANLGGQRNYHGTRMRRLVPIILQRNAGTLLGARTPNGDLVAAVCAVWDNSAARYLLATRRSDLAGGGATMLLIWEVIRVACQRGIGFDFDGITSPASLEFLAAFGGSLTRRLRVRRASPLFNIARSALSWIGRDFPSD